MGNKIFLNDFLKMRYNVIKGSTKPKANAGKASNS